ncbi:MAG TPA: cyclic nucleotide-binding domain-containing protein [Hyphomicrobiaceae bacterium]|jgi:CRP-like cAMP-binding protein|nr:cyclic nucleotide-binding domain-containing protein [Hyphomicrobiaceae bacterium]
MSIDQTVALLQRIPIFARLSPAQITEIAKVAEPTKFRSGHRIIEAGASGEAAYLLVCGDAERAAAAGQLLPPGSLIGELAMLIDCAYPVTIVAKGRVLCLQITRPAMHGLMLSDPSLAEALSQHISERLRKAANGLMRIDRLLAKNDAAAATCARFPVWHSAHLSAHSGDGVAPQVQRMQ